MTTRVNLDDRKYLFNVSFSFSFGKSALIDCLINPLQEQMEEWKKVANQLDKDHAKGTGQASDTEWLSEKSCGRVLDAAWCLCWVYWCHPRAPPPHSCFCRCFSVGGYGAENDPKAGLSAGFLT